MTNKIQLQWGVTKSLPMNIKEELIHELSAHAKIFADGFDLDFPVSMWKEIKSFLQEKVEIAFTVVGRYDDKICISFAKDKEALDKREGGR